MAEKLSCEILIAGGGLSGLACAQLLDKAGVDWLLVEKAEAVGGRLRTLRTEDGFLIDRGFQVLNTAYPALPRVVDVAKLKLGDFASGAEVFAQGRFHRIGDPLRKIEDLIPTLQAPLGSLNDKIRILKLVFFCQDPANHSSVEGMTTEEFLAHFGFTEKMVERFFRPFFGGVFLEEELTTTASKFVTLFSYFSQGKAALPAGGMQALPDLMAAALPTERIHLQQAVKGWKKGSIETKSLTIKAKQLVLAGWNQENLLLGTPLPATHPAHTISFSRDHQPSGANRYLKLNGSHQGKVQTVALNSAAQSAYAPQGKDLVVVSTRGQASVGEVMEELIPWFGEQVKDWSHLHTDVVRQALPQETSSFSTPDSVEEKGFKIHLCGDHTETGSIQGALTSGRKAAQKALAYSPTSR